MFFQPPDDEDKGKKNQINPHRRKKHARKNKQKALRKLLKRKQSNSPFGTTMSAWAENFTKAATWQLENQVAYWKSKAKALEYENSILHDIIRKNYLNEESSKASTEHLSIEENEEEPECKTEEMNANDDFEVSEEYLQFLTQNAKFKEEARLERERLKALNDTDAHLIKEMEAGPSENKDNKQETSKILYGDRWQRISALETLLQSQFIDICDREKPTLWPNIPFNFNFS